MTVASPEEIAWAGGLFEGEGSFYLDQRTPSRRGFMPRARASVKMTDEDSLRRFHNIVGIGNVHGPYLEKSRPKTKPSWIWATSGYDGTLTTIKLLWRWLGIRRRAKAIEVIQGCAIPGKWGKKSQTRAEGLGAIEALS